MRGRGRERGGEREHIFKALAKQYEGIVPLRKILFKKLKVSSCSLKDEETGRNKKGLNAK